MNPVQSARQVLSALNGIATLPKEFVELGRSREKAGDDAAAQAFFSCAARVGEFLQSQEETSCS